MKLNVVHLPVPVPQVVQQAAVQLFEIPCWNSPTAGIFPTMAPIRRQYAHLVEEALEEGCGHLFSELIVINIEF
jgi:hypothetical protein